MPICRYTPLFLLWRGLAMTLANQSTTRAMLVLALPVLGEESLNLLVGYTDFVLAGRFLRGTEPLAAMGLVNYFLWLLPSLFSLVSIGGLALVARFVGAGQHGSAAHATRQALRLGLLVTGVALLVVVLGGIPFVRGMGLSGEAARLATRYIWMLAPAIPAIMLEQVGSACLRGAGDTVSGMLARAAVNLVNMSLSAALVTGFGPFPHLGWDGLAIGTTVGHWCGAAIIAWRLRSRLAKHPAAPATWLDRPLVGRILRVGLPGGFDVLAVIGCHLVYVAIINRVGDLAQAAHALGVQIEAMSYLPGSAFQVAAATLAGQALGAADTRRATRGVLLCVGSATTIMCLAGVVMFFGGENIAVLFTGQRDEVAVLTGELLRIVAWSCPALAVLTVTSGALRGSGDTTWPLAITFMGLVGIRIPGALWLAWDEITLPLVELALPGWGLGVTGAWWAMVADVSVRSVLVGGRFWQGGWQKVRV
ncbi:MAG: MATE family efflux transporter [Pirellulaceae bacterium]|nr:MATE family efflux transporter [Pirellulaceae bacterium]